jgi:outer membrane immunogenic protein
MKKSLLLFLLLPLLAAPVFAQESRQDISVSGTAIIPPFASGNAVQLHATVGYSGGLVSYRYLLTPHGGLELNYQYNQNVQHFIYSGGNYNIHDRFEEISGAYVYSFNFRNWNPFIEGGAAGFLFSPIDDAKTDTFNISRNTNVGAMYGAGIAYEISPSFDIRAEYRGLVMKTPTFNYPGNDLRTNVYYNIYDPVIGIAYHF